MKATFWNNYNSSLTHNIISIIIAITIVMITLTDIMASMVMTNRSGSKPWSQPKYSYRTLEHIDTNVDWYRRFCSLGRYNETVCMIKWQGMIFMHWSVHQYEFQRTYQWIFSAKLKLDVITDSCGSEPPTRWFLCARTRHNLNLFLKWGSPLKVVPPQTENWSPLALHKSSVQRIASHEHKNIW